MSKHGFTLLEVILFLAISSLLTMIAVIGFGPRLRNVRFSDAVRSLESGLSHELSGFGSGESLRTNGFVCTRDPANRKVAIASGSGQATGSAEDCVLNGKLATFMEDRVVYYPIVSSRHIFEPCSAGQNEPIERLLCYGPTIVGQNVSGVNAPLYANGAKNTAAPFSVLYLRQTDGSQLYPSAYTQDTVVATVEKVEAAKLGSLPRTLCLTLGPRRAELVIQANTIQPKITFDKEC